MTSFVSLFLSRACRYGDPLPHALISYSPHWHSVCRQASGQGGTGPEGDELGRDLLRVNQENHEVI